MSWARVKGMKLKPNCCVGCGSTGEMTEDGPPDAYFAEGVDINWGDSVYICESCARVIGQLAGFIEPEEATRLQDEMEKAITEAEEVQAVLDKTDARLQRIVDGSKALKEQKTAKKPKKEPANA